MFGVFLFEEYVVDQLSVACKNMKNAMQLGKSILQTNKQKTVVRVLLL